MNMKKIFGLFLLLITGMNQMHGAAAAAAAGTPTSVAETICSVPFTQAAEDGSGDSKREREPAVAATATATKNTSVPVRVLSFYQKLYATAAAAATTKKISVPMRVLSFYQELHAAAIRAADAARTAPKKQSAAAAAAAPSSRSTRDVPASMTPGPTSRSSKPPHLCGLDDDEATSDDDSAKTIASLKTYTIEVTDTSGTLGERLVFPQALLMHSEFISHLFETEPKDTIIPLKQESLHGISLKEIYDILKILDTYHKDERLKLHLLGNSIEHIISIIEVADYLEINRLQKIALKILLDYPAHILNKSDTRERLKTLSYDIQRLLTTTLYKDHPVLCRFFYEVMTKGLIYTDTKHDHEVCKNISPIRTYAAHYYPFGTTETTNIIFKNLRTQREIPLQSSRRIVRGEWSPANNNFLLAYEGFVRVVDAKKVTFIIENLPGLILEGNPWSPDGTLFVRKDGDRIIIRDMTNNIDIPTDLRRTHLITSLSWSRDSNFLIVGRKEHSPDTCIYNVKTKKLAAQLLGNNCQLSATGKFCATQNKASNEIRIYEFPTDKMVRVLSINCDSTFKWSSKNDSQFATIGCGKPDHLKIWDVDTGIINQSDDTFAIGPRNLEWSKDDQYIAAPMNENEVYVWDIEALHHTMFACHNSKYIKSLQWSDDSNFLTANTNFPINFGKHSRLKKSFTELTFEQIDLLLKLLESPARVALSDHEKITFGSLPHELQKYLHEKITPIESYYAYIGGIGPAVGYWKKHAKPK